jgi:hypothetical protein
MNPPMTKIEIATKARDYLRDIGWCSGRSQDGPFRCAYSAILHVGKGPDVETVYDDLSKMLKGRDFLGLVDFNDRPGRTKAQVVALFDEYIASAEGVS